MAKMGKKIGIDLGTTNSVVAVVDGPRPRTVDNKQNKPMTRSVVGVKKKRKAKEGEQGAEILVGAPALKNWPMAPEDTIVSIKRLMGRAITDDEVKKVRQWADYEIVEPSDGTSDAVCVVMDGKEYTPIQISTMILAQLKEDAEFRLGEEVTHAVITVPAYFSQIQRAATRKAGNMAGLKVMRILDEPTAVAIAFGIDAEAGNEPKNLMVFDLGGGTFDISVLMWAGNVFAPLNVEGDMWLGGDDFDQVLIDHVLKHVREEYDLDPTRKSTKQSKRFMVELKKAAQDCKEQLSSAKTADIVLTGMLHDEDGDLIDIALEVTREEYEGMIEKLVKRTVRISKEAVEKAGMTLDQIDYVLMAGNSSCIPKVQESIEELFGADKVLRRVHPKNSVAMGAAVLARQLSKIVCQAPDPEDPSRECEHHNELDATECAKCGRPLDGDRDGDAEDRGPVIIPPVGIAPYPYGTQTAGDKFDVFVEKGDAYPTENPKTQTFFVRTANQRMISIPVFGGETMEKASANEKQGECFAVLPPGLHAGAPVRIKLWLNDDGIFELTAHLDDGTDLNPWITQGGKDARAVEAMQQVEELLATQQSRVSPQQARAIEDVRDQAFDRLKSHDHGGAVTLARQAAREIAAVDQQEQSSGAEAQAQQLIGFTEFLIQEYSWALQSSQVMRLTKLVEETRKAMEAGNAEELARKTRELDMATDTLPPVVAAILSLRHAINGRLGPLDPGNAGQLMGELDDIESKLKSGDIAAAKRLEDLNRRVSAAIKQAEASAPKPPVCAVCGTLLQGQRYCPACNADSWLLGDKGGSGLGSDKIISY